MIQRCLLLIALSTAMVVNADEIYDAWGRDVASDLVAFGVDKREAERVVRRIETLAPMATGPGSWVYELSVPGEVHLREAQAYELKGRNDRALASYRRAMRYFDAARFPALYTDDRAEAYRHQLHAYRKVAKLSNFPLELIDIPFEGKHIKVQFHAAGDDPHPVLIWSGGLDGWKTGGMELKQRLMDEGMSVLSVDLPGTGESEWLLEADSERIYSRVIEYLQTRDDVDSDRIAVYFGSFSGVYAIKLALINPDVAAAVNHSGGIHLFFHPPMDVLPPLTTTMGMRATATIFAMGKRDADLEEIKDHFSTFSLMRQGLLKPTPNQGPLLNIYGTADRLMPIQDLDVLMESGIEATNLVYEGALHMAWEHAEDHQQKMIDWLKVELAIN